jgi:hypothetical protein
MSTSHTQDPTTHKWHMQYILKKNCHEYDPVDEIMGLAQHFTKWS